MALSPPRAALVRGCLVGLPFLLVVVPFAGLFGALAAGAGLSLAEVMGFSVLVIAGVAQFTALQLMTEQAPTVVIILSALAVNLRMAMYSASLAVHMGAAPFWTRVWIGYFNVDQSYAASALEFERRPEMSLPEKVAFFFGVMIPIAPVWYISTLGGALLGGTLLPEGSANVFLPLTFLAMMAPGLLTAAHRWAALTAAVAGLVLAGVPYSLGLIPAAGLGMAVGAELERRREARP